MSNQFFSAPEGDVLDDLSGTSAKADEWIEVISTRRRIPVTPEGPWIDTVFDLADRFGTALSLAAACGSEFLVEPPHLDYAVKAAIAELRARPEGAE